MKRILLVEDDPIIGKALKSDLVEEGYDVTWAPTLAAGKKALAATKFDLLLLDVNLPDGTSFDLCREARADSPRLPIYMLTARVDEDSAVKGLSVGATDYLRKPFGRRELLLRLKLALGQRGGHVTVGKLTLDLDARRARGPECDIALTPREFEILSELMERAGEAVTRAQMLASIDERGEIFEGTLNSHLSRIRQKLGKAGVDDVRIVPVYGVGYRLEKCAP